MKVRLRDWASLNCITERTVQIHIKENQEALEGHIERKGKQGTWLDDFAQEFLIEKIQLPSRKEVYQPTARENALLIELSEANRRLADAERRAAINVEAAVKLEAAQKEAKLLEGFIADAKAEIGVLNDEKRDLSVEIGKLTQRVTQAEESAQKANAELTALKQRNLWQRIWNKGGMNNDS